MTSKIVKLLALSAILSIISVGASAQDAWKNTWDATVAKAKGQRLVLSVHAASGYAATVQKFRKAYPDI